jgi:hypothetical protein
MIHIVIEGKKELVLSGQVSFRARGRRGGAEAT